MTAAETMVNAEYELLTGQAYRRYRDSLPEQLRADLDLIERLAGNKTLMRVLYLAALDLDPRHVDSWAEITPADRADAKDRGLIYATGHRMRLTREGFAMWWQWQYELTPHLHKPWFRDLWKQVCGW